MRILATAMTLGLVAACSTPPFAKNDTVDDFDPAKHDSAVLSARWEINVYSGRGIPGSPGADIYIPNYQAVLHKIVDDCRLGQTILQQATDGVSILYIANQNLSDDQVSCIRAEERPGLKLHDRGDKRAFQMEEG